MKNILFEYLVLVQFLNFITVGHRKTELLTDTVLRRYLLLELTCGYILSILYFIINCNELLFVEFTKLDLGKKSQILYCLTNVYVIV